MTKDNDDGIIFADKNLGIPSNSSNKPLYIVVTEDPSSKIQIRIFGTEMVTKNANSVDFNGYELTHIHNTKIKELRTHTDMLNLAKQDSTVQVISLSVPWNRIINIENATYQLRNKSAK